MQQYLVEAARAKARQEMDEEDYHAEKEREKARIRKRQQTPWWHHLCPFVITIKRRD
jgi:hypothetical protein